MYFSLALIASLVASATATAIDIRVEPGAPSLQKRQYLTIDLCKDLDLRPGPTGGCTGITTSNGGCYGDFSLLTQDGGNWDNTVTSAFPLVEVSPPNFYCVLYEHPYCTGRALTLTGPAYDLRQQSFDDIASSVRCYGI